VGSYNTVGIVQKLQWTRLPPHRKCGIRKCKCKGKGNCKRNNKSKDKGKVKVKIKVK
jgi:hypothetical protein